MSAQKVVDYFRRYGNNEYGDLGENITQTEHAIQAGLAAKNNQAPVAIEIAAFLHDIGHLIGIDQKSETMDQYGIKDHEEITRSYLKECGFSAIIYETAGNHVKAKRYQSSQAEYYSKLSKASQETLRRQGGILSKQEQEEFEKEPYFQESLEVRKYDDLAKDSNWLGNNPNKTEIINNYLDQYQNLIENYLKIV